MQIRDQKLWTLTEAAEFLQMHFKTVEYLARKGRIPAMKIGTRWRFSESQLREWCEQRSQL
jgi:excisionase family DNA binding protein